MKCFSSRVKEFASNSTSSQELIQNKLRDIEIDYDSQEVIFHSEINKFIEDGKITDAIDVMSGRSTFIEFSDENNSQTIINAAKSKLELFDGLLDSEIDGIKLNQEIIDQKANFVLEVIDTVKSSNQESNSNSFSSVRIVPGALLFIYTSSSNSSIEDNIKDQTLTTTVVFYNLKVSKDDINFQKSFNDSQAKTISINEIKVLQVELIDAFKNGDISMEEWMEQDKAFQNEIDILKAKISSVNNKIN